MLRQALRALEGTETSSHVCLYAPRNGDGLAMSWAATHGEQSSRRRAVHQVTLPRLPAVEVLGEFSSYPAPLDVFSTDEQQW